ncbi:2-hydroxymuconate tautomerase [Aquicoccus porphyridii]|jgi:4-oxalocrotonate tautomerase|uniref:Tautomerase n=1 Tax=Aquicoccus porphyridii TaxID=1852029 RepID=A0A5A9YXQ3_9RHOB|nr:2-hydroxymuconate tautomerase [Aquicoccus porphyridii]KAA0909665.1 2-hydroxymuconate tautomerase [Aquicoccus porphyridii]RAI51971.1 2-hydroxymuconate tautomerase [Rhodobacteraceae bacterium AsT-22]
MPIAEILIFEGRSDDQKRAIMRGVTDALARSMDAEPERIRVILKEIPTNHFSVAGVSIADSRAAGNPPGKK